jgi:hypothetical protein
MRIKDINTENILFSKKKLQNGSKIINLSYLDSEKISFQTPKVYISEIINNEYLILKLLNTQSTQLFINKIKEIEKYLSNKLNIQINSLLNESELNLLKVKIPFKNESPCIKIINDNNLVNFYKLNEFINNKLIILLVDYKYIFIDMYNKGTLNLLVNEILIL